MEDIIAFFSGLLNPTGFPARWVCGKWSDFHGWVYIISDLLIWIAYSSIPLILAYFIFQKKDFPFKKLLTYFIAFIMFCGATHLVDAIIFWFPVYRLNGFLLACTAIISCLTAYKLYEIIPELLEYTSPAELKRIIEEKTEELKKTNQQLRESESQFKTLVENNSDIICRIDSNYITKFVNDSVSNHTNLQPSDIVGKTALEIGYPNEYVHELYKGIDYAIQTEKPYEYETTDWSNPTHERYFSITINPIKQENGKLNGVISVTKDVTSKKQTEKMLKSNIIELEKTSTILKKRNESLEDFAYIVSHNLRSPIGNFEGLLNFYEKQKKSDKKTEIFELLKSSSQGLKNTVQNLTDIVEIEQNGQKIEREKIEFQSVLNKNKDFISSEIEASDATIEYDFEKCPDIQYPKVYLESIILNLLTNAIKYRSPNRKPKIRFSTKIADGSILLSCKDNGLGIDLEKHGDKIFKLNKVFSDHPDARGVGLFITQKQVEALGGTISVMSELDKGTEFTVNFGKENQ